MVRRALERSFRQCLARNLSTAAESPRERRLRSLEHSLQTGAGAHRVWDMYTDIITASGPAALPLAIHRQVLRQCTPPKDSHRESMVQRIQNRTFTDSLHVHENRFQLVLQAIKSLGETPDADDFYFVMDHLAAVGNYQAVLALHRHMLALAVEPTARTFGACFRAIATRFALPIHPDIRKDIVAYATDAFRELMHEHRARNVVLSPTNMELILRILKESLDRPTFDLLLRTSYGIDLANPDRIALEYDQKSDRVPLPFTTAALNTTLDMLGRLQDVPRLVSAFEVLTQPLPGAQDHFFNAFEEDDDGANTSPPRPRIPPPHAVPNTTSYTTLIRYLARHGHSALARHYLLVAIHLDRHVAGRLRMAVQQHLLANKDLSLIPAPSIAIPRAAFLPVLGAANRNKDIPLLEWVAVRLEVTLSSIRSSLAFFEAVQARQRVATEPPIIPRNATLPTKPLDLALHVRILRRNAAEIAELSQRAQFLLARTRQRAKERLGRRVWAGRDVFLRTAPASPSARASAPGRVGARVVVPREEWRDIVAFQPMTPALAAVPHGRPGGPVPTKERRKPSEPVAPAPPPPGGARRGLATRVSVDVPRAGIPPPIPCAPLWRRRS